MAGLSSKKWTSALLTTGMVALLVIAPNVHPAKPETLNSDVKVSLPLEKVQLAIVRAGAMKGWEMTERAPGHLEATVRVRKHVAVVDIRFDETRYSITYNRSENLGFKDGRIHKRFNQWIERLDRDIAAMLTYM